MSVWFAHRSHYNLPATRFVKRFDEPSLVEWFRKHCPPISDGEQADAHVRQLLGIEPPGFAYFLTQYAESQLAPPRTERALHDLVRQCWHVEGEVVCQPGAIQVLDDDDELEFACYLFDDAFARKHPERTAWLTQEDWRLPADVGPGGFRPLFRTHELEPHGRWTGTTYLVSLSYYDSLNLTDLSGAGRLPGVRLPQFARWLAAVQPAEREGLGYMIEDVAKHILAGRPRDATEKAFLHSLRADPTDDGRWEVFGDWLEERGFARADLHLLDRVLERISKADPRPHCGDINPQRKRNHSMWHVTEHLVQLCLHTATYGRFHNFVHWVFFDDLWASAHSALANSLLRQEDRWDVLSSPRRPRTE